MSSKFVLTGSCTGSKYIVLDPRANSDFQKAVAMFGTVELVAAEASITIPGFGATQGLVAIGFIPNSASATQASVRHCTTSLFVPQPTDGGVYEAHCDLSVFGNELKGVVKANDPPKLIVWPTGFYKRDWTKKVDDANAYVTATGSDTLAYARLTITISAKSNGALGGEGTSNAQ